MAAAVVVAVVAAAGHGRGLGGRGGPDLQKKKSGRWGPKSIVLFRIFDMQSFKVFFRVV